MKKLSQIIFMLSLLLIAACGQKDDNTDIGDQSANQADRVVQASITQMEGNLIYVEPVPGSWELQSSSSFLLSADLIEKGTDYDIGSVLEITYDGKIQETWPARFENIEKVVVSGDTLPDVDFRAQYIRTNGYLDGEEYPKIFWISTAKELKEYYEVNKEKYDLESRANPYSEETIGFTDAIKNYDEHFFEENEVIFVRLEEGSGSMQHEVTEVRVLPPQVDGKQYAIQPVVERLVPQVGTADMAEWHIIIEVSKKFGSEASVLERPVIIDMEPQIIPNEMVNADVASVVGPYGQISVSIPETWNAETYPVDSGEMTVGLYGLFLYPKDAKEGHIELFYADSFGVCGTGLSQEEITLAGDSAYMGTYDNNEHWNFITYGGANTKIVATHSDCDSWTDEAWEEALSILDTVRLDKSRANGGAGQYIPESENDTIAVIMSVSNVTPGGATVHIRQYDRKDARELLYGEGYLMERLEGSTWIEVPRIIENGAFTDEGYSIPTEGEAVIETNWEWMYGKLTPGTYRITKTVWDGSNEGGHDNIPAYPLKAQFYLAG
ncbi:MAG: hypothetical protein IJ733_08290 [Lachnospiraceae bacterium]|nr:hypothetical protein [Lachnospiraceae bacterium]